MGIWVRDNAQGVGTMTYVDENGAEKLPEGRFFDWPTNDLPNEKHCGLQGLLRLALLRGGDIMKILGETETAAECYLAADKLLAHKPVPTAKQPAALLAIGGVCEAKEMFDKVIGPGGAAGLSTFLGYYTLCACAEAGEYEAALDIIRNYWGKMIEMGATTFWEDFDLDWMINAGRIDEVVPEGMVDIHGDYGNYCYIKFRHSLCHGWASGPCPYLSGYVLGVKNLAPGKYEVKPELAWLDWAKGTYPTPKGEIKVWAFKDTEGKTVVKEIVIPNKIINIVVK